MTRACRDCTQVAFMEHEGRPAYGDSARCKFFDCIVPLGDCCPKWEPWTKISPHDGTAIRQMAMAEDLKQEMRNMIAEAKASQ